MSGPHSAIEVALFMLILECAREVMGMGTVATTTMGTVATTTTTTSAASTTTLFPTATYPSSGQDLPVFSHWTLTTSVATAAAYASTCATACTASKPCPRGTMMCFGKKQQVVPGSVAAVPSSWPASLSCDCSSSAVKRWPGVFCGPRRQACAAAATWIDGSNTIIQGYQGTGQ